MNDRISLARKPRADGAAYGGVSRRTLLCRLGVTAAFVAAASLATAVPAPAQTQQSPGAQPQAPKAPPPRRRGISAPDAAPSSAPSPAGKSMKSDDDDVVPGGLPGARPKTPLPGGGPSNPGG